MAEQEKWQWQPLLGTLEIPEGDPTKTAVRRTPLGNALVDCLLDIPNHHPEVQVLHFCLMPDRQHAVLYVRRTMPTGIKGMVRGFWQGVKKLGRASSIIPNDIRGNHQEGIENRNRQEGTLGLREATRNLEVFAEGLKGQMSDEGYYNLPSVFTEMPFIRPMGRRTQLPNTIRYIDMNPQRLATKRLMPGFFRVQKGTVMVSPFISQQEKQVMQVLINEQHPFILFADNGFREYYKPSDALFDACAAGRVLILSPWPYDAGKRHISRADCVKLNIMAEEFCKAMEPANE